MYQYWGYGLLIESEIEFPELLPYSFETPDVTITIGKTPEYLAGDNVLSGVRVQISPTEYLLKLLNIANYYVAEGNKVIVEPNAGADKKSIRLFLLSSAFAAILYQRDLIPLHASAIEYQDGIALFCGPSGVGKSTTVAMLGQKGYKIFSDDVCVLRASTKNGVIEALPSYPMVKLWQDSFTKLDIEMAGEDNRLRPQLPKYARFYHNEFVISPKQTKKIFVLEKSKLIASPEIKSLRSVSAFSELQKNAYRSMQMDAMMKRNVLFATISKLTMSTPVYRVCRPEFVNSVEPLCSLLETNLHLND